MRREKLLVGRGVLRDATSPRRTPLERQRTPVVKLMLDSGAFAAWNSDAQIDLHEYSDFLERNRDSIWHPVSLDVIPGKPGSIRHRSDYDIASDASYRNHQYLKGRGLSPIPVYHQGEALRVLERYLKDGETYIGISPSDDTDRKEQQRWLDASFAAVTNMDGKPFIKTHGFGVANANFIRRYPWTSLDSITWAYGVFRGRLFLPALDARGEPDWLGDPTSVFLVAPGYDGDNHPKYENLGDTLRAAIDSYLENYVGCTAMHARYDTYWRRKVAIHYFEGISDAVRGRPLNVLRSLLDFVDVAPYAVDKLNAQRRIIYATTNAWDRNKLLNDMSMNYRLLSYLYFAKLPEGSLAIYAQTGRFPGDEGDKQAAIRTPKRSEEWSVNYKNQRAIRMLERIEAYRQRGDVDGCET